MSRKVIYKTKIYKSPTPIIIIYYAIYNCKL